MSPPMMAIDVSLWAMSWSPQTEPRNGALPALPAAAVARLRNEPTVSSRRSALSRWNSHVGVEEPTRIVFRPHRLEAPEISLGEEAEWAGCEILVCELDAGGKPLQAAHMIRHPGLVRCVLGFALPRRVERDVEI